MFIKIGNKRAGSYIDYIRHNPAEKIEILSRGSFNSKSVYVAGVVCDFGYEVIDFNIGLEDIGKKEPLAVLNIVLRANNGSADNCKTNSAN